MPVLRRDSNRAMPYSRYRKLAGLVAGRWPPDRVFLKMVRLRSRPRQALSKLELERVVAFRYACPFECGIEIKTAPEGAVSSFQVF